MRGHADGQPNLFVRINLEEIVPSDHPLRGIKRLADQALRDISRTLAAAYENTGRRSIPPERLLKAQVLKSLYTVRSDRALCERIQFDLLFRWFLDMTPDEPCFDHSTFTANDERLGRLDVTRKFSDRIVRIAAEHGLLSKNHFSIDGSLLQSHASLKSLKRIERAAAAEERSHENRSDSDDQGPTPPSTGESGPVHTDSNRWVDFRGEKRSNKTHRSTTDPQARLSTKTSGVAYLQHSMHVLIDNRWGIGVDIEVGPANGHAERACALKMLDRQRRRFGIKPMTLGADKGYDSENFLLELESRNIEPRVASKASAPMAPPPPDRDGAWARWHNQRRQDQEEYRLSQRKRRLVEEIFGWFKSYGGLRRAMVVGRKKVQRRAEMGLASLNLLRISKLVAT